MIFVLALGYAIFEGMQHRVPWDSAVFLAVYFAVSRIKLKCLQQPLGGFLLALLAVAIRRGESASAVAPLASGLLSLAFMGRKSTPFSRGTVRFFKYLLAVCVIGIVLLLTFGRYFDSIWD